MSNLFFIPNEFTYIIYSQTKNRYYIGSSKNIKERLIRHNAGATKSTKPGRPWSIVYFEKFESKSDAIKREFHLKRMKSKIFIENLIRQNTDG
jgi:putative endonuclease